jgi:riboflavin kinase/FMN adenylyltransferase
MAASERCLGATGQRPTAVAPRRWYTQTRRWPIAASGRAVVVWRRHHKDENLPWEGCFISTCGGALPEPGGSLENHMHVFSQLSDISRREPAVLTIGFFDGVHRGHQRLVQRTVELARQAGARAVLITFWPHPLTVLRPEQPVQLLTTLEERLALLQALGGLDAAIVMAFTPELARLSPEEYLGALRDRFALRALVEGPDFAFGRDRLGNVEWLRRASATGGFAVETLAVEADGQRISSTRIRGLIAAGAVEVAAQLLGRPYMLDGTVITGDRRGRTLGFPTANLCLDARKLVPAHGVYAVRVGLPGDESALRPGVANIGVRPTFGEGNTPLVEVHLLDTQADLYGQRMTTAFIARLREERRFPGLDALKAQIAADANHARELLGPAAALERQDTGR